MSERAVEHDTFVVERTYDASPARVFAAWADPAAKVRWFTGPEEGGNGEFELDFRVGGREFSRSTLPNGQVYTLEAHYQDIVPNERFVYTYDMHVDARRISVSLGTVELAPADAGTRLTYTEQGAYLDGLDSADQRRQGTGQLLDALGAHLQSESASA